MSKLIAFATPEGAAIIQAARKAVGETTFRAAIAALNKGERAALSAYIDPIPPSIVADPRSLAVLEAATTDAAAIAERRVEMENLWTDLAQVSPILLANYLKNEYPQTVAVILGVMPIVASAAILPLLPENFSVEVQMRMLRMSPVQPEVLDTVARIVRVEFLTAMQERPVRDNHDVLRDIFATMDERSAARFLSALRERNRESAERVRGDMVVFDDLVWLGDGARAVIAACSPEDVAAALFACSSEVMDCILEHLGTTVAAVQSALGEAPSPREVMAAQGRIAEVTKQLLDAGKVSFGGWHRDGSHLARVADIVKLVAKRAASPAPQPAPPPVEAPPLDTLDDLPDDAEAPGGFGGPRSQEDEEAMMQEWASLAGGHSCTCGHCCDGDGDSDNADREAAEWEAMLGASDAEDGEDEDCEAGGVTTRVLNQDEIDSLLGFDDAHDGNGERSGIQAILNSALVSYERLPMLEIVFDRMVRMMSTSLRNFTSDNVEVSLDNILSLRFGDYLNSIPLPAMLAVFKAEEWDNYGVLTIDSSLVYSIVDVLLGGRRGTAAMRIEGRPYTSIERALVERLVQVVLADLSASFDPLSPVTFRLERIETNPRFATISRPSNAAIVAKLRIDMEDRGGRMELLLPYATLEPVRELLLQMFMGEKFGRDAIWETHLAEELWLTNTQLEAVLAERSGQLSEVLGWRVGDTVMLDAPAVGPMTLRIGGAAVGTADAVRRNGRFAAEVRRTRTNPETQTGDTASDGE